MAKKQKAGRLKDAIQKVGTLRVALCALLAFGGGGLAFALAVSGAQRANNPDAALLFTPHDSVALAGSADRRFFLKPEKPSPAVRRMAVAALQQQAINPKALRLLGYIADIEKKPEQAKALIQQASLLSRREPGTQLWLIEATARDGDVPKTLRHYDLLLRTKPDSQAVLFPRLVNAISDADIRKEFLPYLRSDKGWVSGFLTHAIYNNPDLTPLVTLLVENNGFPKVAASRVQELQLMTRLAQQRKFDDAQRIFRLIPGARAQQLTDVAFDAGDRTGRFGVMGWTMADESDVGGGFSGGAEKSRPTLSVYANPATTRIVASKLLYLPPGSYRFAATLGEFNGGDGGAVRWQMRCPTRSNNQPVWQAEMGSAKLALALTVPAGCPVQYLDLVVSGGDGQNGMEAVISWVGITQ